ncbi:DUF2591 family protein [Ralstonia pickettii]|nr:DUF2591 family protein [Ralstonia pickettii]
MKVSDLEGALLDHWVGRANGWTCNANEQHKMLCIDVWRDAEGKICGPVPAQAFRPSTEWLYGGTIIEREGITLLDPEFCESGQWEAFMGAFPDVTKYSIVGMVAQGAGPTPLIAAMRAFVASKFGDEVPDQGSK